MRTSELISEIQNLGIDREYLLTRNISDIDISKPIELSNLLFRKTGRFIGYTTLENLPFEINSRIEAFDCYAYKESYTLLGVLLFELLFSNQTFIELKIQNEQSEFKQVFISVDRENRDIFHHSLEIESKETYKSFEYFSQKIDKFPLSQFPQNERNVLENDLPTFYLGCSDYQFTHSKEFIEKSDQLIITTTTSGLIQLAELLFDIGLTKNKQNEICLENPLYGFGGVSKTSIEARFWLPNSFGFYSEKIGDLKF